MVGRAGGCGSNPDIGNPIGVLALAVGTLPILRLLSANLKSDPRILDEVSGLLLELSSAWREIGKAPTASASPPMGMPKSALDPQPPVRPPMNYGAA